MNALVAFCLLGAVLALPAHAQTSVPDTPSMINALKPAASRGMRNLVVRQTAEAAAADTTASAPAATAAPGSAPTAAPGSAPTTAPGPVATASTTAAPASAAATATAAPSLSLAIQFETNSSRVRPESGPVLGNLVAAMLSPDLKASRFVIEGHTDARGLAALNQRLSQERAEEVRLYLVALGVHPARLKAVGKGASEPANVRDPQAAENRRVRVVTVE
jgi:outer membrane protein OmpA-like peptidoglycan-associated protein